MFFAFLVFRFVEGVWALTLDIRSDLYMYTWTLTRPVFWAFYILVVVEFSKFVLLSYKGLYTVFRTGMLVSVAVGTVVSGLTLIPKITPALPQKSRILWLLMSTERGIEFALAVFILLLLLIISRYPVALSRNVRAHAVIYSAFFTADAMGLIVRTFFGLKFSTEVSIISSVVEASALICWLLVLSPAGEIVVKTEASVSRAREERLLAQLDAINTTLLRVSQH
jgi:hypothetical protein